MYDSLAVQRRSAVSASSRSSFPDEDLFKAFNDAKQPSMSNKAIAGTIGTVAVPLNLVTGAVSGVLKGVHHGAKIGHDKVPVLGAFLGGLVIGPVIGVVAQPVSDISSGIINTRRATGRYSFINSGLSVKTDSKKDLKNILFHIPEERISKNSDTGHTIVTIKQDDKPFVSEDGISGLISRLEGNIDTLGGRYSSEGIRYVDIESLLEKTGSSGIFDKKVAIKSRDLNALVSPRPQLCKSSTDKLRTSIYIQSNITDAEKAGLAGLQFFDQLDRAVNDR